MAGTNLGHFLRFTVVVLSCVLAFCIRLFSNVTSEPMIHEFDPHFNWRCAQYVDKHGLYEFFGWFDNISWYPQGRLVGETSYPGLMFTSVLAKWALRKLHIVIDLRDACIFTGPVFAVLSTLLAFLYGREIGGADLGVLAVAITSLIPGLISRSMAGAYDYECASLYSFTKALSRGSILWATLSGFFYGCMAAT
jgi:dolichyl-diphosphooligosaccharide--protein glycosyltransferase